jgi:hypothetical protein
MAWNWLQHQIPTERCAPAGASAGRQMEFSQLECIFSYYLGPWIMLCNSLTWPNLLTENCTVKKRYSNTMSCTFCFGEYDAMHLLGLHVSDCDLPATQVQSSQAETQKHKIEMIGSCQTWNHQLNVISVSGGHLMMPILASSKHTDVTIHWKAQKENFLMVPLVFQFNKFPWNNAFYEYFSKTLDQATPGELFGLKQGFSVFNESRIRLSLGKINSHII